MRPSRLPDTSTPTAVAWLGCYAAWIVLSAVSLPLFWLFRTNLLDVARLQGLSPTAVSAVDRFGSVILGLVWLAGVIALETWLRNGTARHRLVFRLTRITIVLAILFGVSLLLHWLA